MRHQLVRDRRVLAAQLVSQYESPVPDIVGRHWSNVQKELDAVGFAYGTPATAYSNSVAFGDVVSVKPGAGKRERGGREE